MKTAYPRFIAKTLLGLLAFGLAAVVSRPAQAQDPCLGLTDPADWPPAARPYFMVVADTSGSMAACTNPPTVWPETCADVGGGIANSCGWEPLRVNDAKCALRNTILAFGGQVNFGLATFSHTLSNCPADCDAGQYWTGSYWYRYAWYGCTLPFPGSGCGGANIVVDMLPDTDPPGTNAASLLQYMDDNCGDNRELFAYDATPLGASLQNVLTYFQSGVAGHPSPLNATDPACRSLNVILMTDGGETCSGDPVTAAQQLYNGFTKDGIFRRVRTHVIAFNVDDAPSQVLLDNTHKMGQCGTTSGPCADAVDALLAIDEVSLAQAFADIVASAILPEECNNGDDNCNGCVDEGYLHYCNQGKPCFDCVAHAGYPDEASCRDGQTALYEASVVTSPPDGNLALLPCLPAAELDDPSRWLCHDPGEICDDGDNNCHAGNDEGLLKCIVLEGETAERCPIAEVCDRWDNDCDGQIDEDGVCGDCVNTPEVCDGCDNDCDGVIDDGTFPDLACGLPSPAQCVGVRVCDAAQPVPVEEGDCVAGAGYGACSYDPDPETCNGIDDDCDGFVDNNLTLPPTCVPPGHPGGLSYGPPSQCEYGTPVCDGTNGIICVGGVGPSPEICDGIDNDCVNGVDNGNLPGEGQGCGTTTGECEPGVTDCVNGTLVCGGGTGPVDELCDGLDNDCDGAIDDAPLDDAPLTPGCWTLPGNCCSHTGSTGTVTWCPPPGGTCDGVGTLDPPCLQGSLRCIGAQGWECTNDRTPVPEVCDGIDNDCNGTVDDGDLPGVGDICGTDVGECQPGQIACSNGILDCVGDVPPTPEICDGLDNDCVDGVDNGIPIGDPCTPTYDTGLYPGVRTFPPCQPGNLQCSNGGLVCVGGLGPNPEICDGVDNDCDGTIDETGAPPNGVDGTDNPVPPPDGAIGDGCGNDEGTCNPGELACVNGQFTCLGSVGPVPELCDCLDNDCDGSTDELPEAGEPALCSEGKDCVNTGAYCVCAPHCGGGEYPCPTGQECMQGLPVSGTEETGNYCIPDFCGDCSQETVLDGEGGVACAPAGSDPPGCTVTPVCACRGQVGCQAPCFNVACPEGALCSEFGPDPGTCGLDTCYHMGCPGCDRACHDGTCVDNPCKPESCADDQACQPSDDFSDFTCVGSCAGIDCEDTEQCIGGSCVTACNPPCGDGQVCDLEASGGPACVADLCLTDGGESPCVDGSCCDPVTGACGDCPCEGVLCPAEQRCVDGQCIDAGPGEGGTGPGGAGPGGAGTAGAGGGEGGSGAVGPGPEGPISGEVWRLPTGGGGCACRVGMTGAATSGPAAWLAVLGVALGLGRAHRGRRRHRAVR